MQEHIAKSMNTVMEVLSKIIERRRLATGKSMYKIAAECGLSKSTWREVELALCKNINLSTLMLIADGLEAPLSDIIKEQYELLGENFTLIDEQYTFEHNKKRLLP